MLRCTGLVWRYCSLLQRGARFLGIAMARVRLVQEAVYSTVGEEVGERVGWVMSMW